MREHTVKGGGGLRLHVIEAGDPEGPPVLFLHGFSQCRLSWRRQFESDVLRDLRLVAMDFRGHGLSEKPTGVYRDSGIWAQDVHAVIETLSLARPVLCAHAYGGVVTGDYLRFHGDAGIKAIVLNGAITKVGTQAATEFISPEFRALAPGLFSNAVDESTRALAEFMRMCTHAELPPSDFYFFLGYNTMVPPYVREDLFSRTVDNDDVLGGLGIPALVVHGENDHCVFSAAAEHHSKVLPNARLSLYEDTGHVPHWERPERFNRELLQLTLGSI